MKWVTWQNVGVDRIGCAWLIRRFIDPKAQFSFIPQGEKPSPKAGEPFDMPGVRFSHHGGHCSFHAIVREHKFEADPVLRRMARIIDEADTVQEANVEPSAIGLDLICTGIRLTSPDDQTAFDRGYIIYDALYAAIEAETRQPAAD